MGARGGEVAHGGEGVAADQPGPDQLPQRARPAGLLAVGVGGEEGIEEVGPAGGERLEELARLRRHWDAAREGEGALVALAGSYGIGKTRLAAELAATAHAAGRRFPRADRAPLIVPVAERALRDAVRAEPALDGWMWARTRRVSAGFYTSQAYELTPTTTPMHPSAPEVPC